MAGGNTSGLAGEYLVAGELSRRGYLVSVTIGNAKAIDIFACTRDRKTTIKVDVKASRYKTSWPIKNVEKTLYYVFVYLQPEERLKRECQTGKNSPPEYYIVPGEDILKKALIIPWKNIPGIKYNSLKEYREKWDLLPYP